MSLKSNKDNTANPMDHVILFGYTNHRGEYAIRTVTPLEICFKTVPYHGKKPIWVFDAFDLDKDARRSFQLSDCNFTIKTATPESK
jgi:hypothetical protein